MKKLLIIALSLLLNNGIFAEDLSINTEAPLEPKIVELHITFAPPPTAEVKKQRKLMLKTKTGQAVCSGSFISPIGHIITARHCVQDTTEIDVVTSDQQEYKADIIGISKQQDLAVIQIGRLSPEFFEIGEPLIKGQRISIIGSPLGLTSTMTEGIVAKLYGDLTLLDCTGLPGNSGGPVIDTNHKLVGVVSAMVIVIFGPAHISVAQSVSSIRFFLYQLMLGKYNEKK